MVLKTFWNRWILACRKVNDFFEVIFQRIAEVVSSRPYTIVLIATFLSLALMFGFLRFRVEDEIEKLFIPQNSIAMRDLSRGHKHFGLKFKVEEFILRYEDGRLALTEQIFKISLDIHNHVAAIPGFTDICFSARKPNDTKVCLVSTPLELFSFNYSLINNISSRLQAAFLNQALILAGGRPAASNYPDFFANLVINQNTGKIYRADAVRSMYYVNFPEHKALLDKSKEWELKFLEYMQTTKASLKRQGIILLFNTGRSINDSTSESSAADVKLISVAFGLMIFFCLGTLARFKNLILGHFVLSLFGILTLALGIGAAFGLVMLTGLPFIAFVGVLPFLILGVGIDNIFIIVDCVDRLQPKLKGKERIKHALGHVGSSITMTTLTDLVAFGVSTVTDFPAIKYFCTYAALGITACYVFMITMFLGYLTIDVQRIENGRRDCFFVCSSRNEGEGNPWKHHESAISMKVMQAYATFLMKKPVKYTVLLLSRFLLALGTWGTINVDQSFDMLSLGTDGSTFVDYFSYRNKAYPVGIPVSVILDEPVDYTDTTIQKEFAELCGISIDNIYMKPTCINWMQAYLEWSSKANISVGGPKFYLNLGRFLSTFPYFLVDLKFNDSGKIEASRMIVFTKDNDHSVYRKDGMLSLRHDLKSKSTLKVYAIHMMYIYFEQFVVILGDTIRNLAICSGAILLITLPYLIHPLITVMVFFSFLSLSIELLGMMYIWNVSLNSISMVIIVMSIGFAVDYSAHVAHAFMISKARCPDQRAIEALKTMGSSVLMGGASTFLGILVTAFASSEIFRIFFKMMFGIVFLGLLHGLVFLPVLLSLFCRTDLRISPTANSRADFLAENEGAEEEKDKLAKSIGDTNLEREQHNLRVEGHS